MARRRAVRAELRERIAPVARPRVERRGARLVARGCANQHQVDVARAFRQLFAERPREAAREPHLRRTARDQFRHVAHLRIADQRGDRVGAGERGRLRAELGRELQRVEGALPPRVGQPLQARRLDVHGDPVGLQARREPRGRAHERRRFGAGPDAHQQPLARLPDALDRTVGAVLAHLRVDAIGRAPQREFAQRDQVALAEEVAHRALGLLREIDLAVAHPLEQFLGRQVDERDFVGRVEHAIGHGLPHADAGDRADHVVQAFEMLDVDGRIDVDARVEQLVDVLPALQVACALHVRMRELVDEDQLRRPRERAVQIEFGERAAAIVDAGGRQHVEAVEQRGGLAAAVGLDDADDDVDAILPALARGLQHRVGLADAGGRAEEDLELAAPLLFFVSLQLVEKLVWIGTVHA